MKITIIQGAFLPVPPVLGGAVEKMWFALGKEFSKRGHSVVHISQMHKEMPDLELIDGVLHKRVKGYKTPSSGLLLKILDLFYSLRATSIVPIDSDVVITNSFWSPIVIGSKLRRRCMVDVQRMPKRQMYFYNFTSRLRANSSPVAAAIKSEMPSSMHTQIVMISNPLPFISSIHVDLLSKKKHILYVGRIHPEKGLDLLINAFNLMKNDWKLKIVGPWETEAGGGGLTYLKNLKHLATNSNIEFHLPIYDIDKLNNIYRDASIFVYPSKAEKGETFGLAPLEAMAWGCATIVSDLACFRDFIKHEENGLIFDHRNKDAVIKLKVLIESLIRDNLMRSNLAQKAVKVNESHSISNIASKFLGEFDRMIHDLKPQNINIYENSLSKKPL